MKILYAQEYNDIICPEKCCPLELCAEPQKICESIDGYVEVAYILVETLSGNSTFYATQRYNYSDGGYKQWHVSQNYNAYLYPLSDPDTWKDLSTVQILTASPMTGTITVVNSDPININTARSTGEASLLAATRWGLSGVPYGNYCYSKYVSSNPGPSNPQMSVHTFSRYKWALPSSLITAVSGNLSAISVYEVKWDIAKVTDTWLNWYEDYTDWKATTWHDYLIDLDSWNECMTTYNYNTDICGLKPEKPIFPGLSSEPTPGPVKISSNTWTYSAPNSASGWYETVPTDSGKKYVVMNLTSRCYNNTSWGVLPTLHGIRYDW